MFKKKSLCLLAIMAATLLLLAVFAPPAYAHGFGERYDLPLPLTYFVFAGAAAVVLSFVVVGLFVRGQHDGSGYPRLNLFGSPALQLILTGPVTWLLRAASLFLFFLVIATGLFGSERPVNNLTPTFVWIIWWVGMGFVVSLLGNLWAVVNPWKVLFGLAESIFHRFNPEWELTLGMDYAERVGVWPSVALFFAFVWVENALPEAASPTLLAWLIIAYSVVTLGGMYLFGKHQWLRHGEVFTVIYGFLSRFSITEVRANDAEVCGECGGPSCGPSINSGRPLDGDRVSGESTDGGGCVDCYECFEYAGDRELNLRPPAIGLHSQGAMPVGLTALVLLVLSTVTFDGFSDTPEWAAVLGWALTQTPQLTSPYFNGLVIANTLGLALFPLAFAGIYWVFSAMMRWVVERERRSQSRGRGVDDGLRLLAGAHSAGLPLRPLPGIPADPGTVDHPPGLGPLRGGRGPVRDGGVRGEPYCHQRAVHLDIRGDFHSGGTHHRGVPGAPAGQYHIRRRVAGPQEPVADAGADGNLHGGEPVDNFAADN